MGRKTQAMINSGEGLKSKPPCNAGGTPSTKTDHV